METLTSNLFCGQLPDRMPHALLAVVEPLFDKLSDHCRTVLLEYVVDALFAVTYRS